jgi:hypothetical protein
MPQSRLQTLALLALVTFSGVGHCEDAGEATRTSATFGVRVSSRGYEQTCSTIQRAAADNGLPVDFFAKLIWQESRFKPDAVSHAGAQGVAQFMPGTARLRGLEDPFDPIQAIAKSAQLLRDLSREFGNLGLAAAAYNAGPGRVRDWLGSRRPLPGETQAYVRLVTGRSVEEWAAGQQKVVEMSIATGVACNLGATTLSEPVSRASPLKAEPVEPWGAEVAGGPTRPKALARYRELQLKYPAILAGRELVRRHHARPRRDHRLLVRVARDRPGRQMQSLSRIQGFYQDLLGFPLVDLLH